MGMSIIIIVKTCPLCAQIMSTGPFKLFTHQWGRRRRIKDTKRQLKQFGSTCDKGIIVIDIIHGLGLHDI